MSQIHTTDVAIIGAGPVGLFAIFECGMLKLKTHVIDALDFAGGQCAALYPEKPIYDIPGYPKIEAAELIARLQEQAAPFSPTYHLGQRVEKLTREGDAWRLETSAGTVIVAKAVLIAAGVGAFGPNKPPMPRIDEFENKGVHYLVNSREAFRGKRVAIAGGGDSALDWTLSLADVAARVMVVHRRDKFRAAPDSVAKVKALADAGKIDMVVPYQLDSLEGEPGALKAVILKDLDGKPRRLEADALLAFFGLSMNLGPIAEWGLDIEKAHIKVEQRTAATSAPGIFAIGDIAHYPGKLKLILSGFAEAAAAAHSARAICHPGETYHFEYSTTSGVPGN
ncbi:MAG: NAD(P)/FAD-dependent oxidoreductase [Alphaproteobacteria bacterium]|nr:NAD(P)/FAD-dependent oxidoreductase [Alphaproteobacteria bacterium]MCA0448697.1 NAD(P)/FAD-dependent oxidoreductase [Pseudomonadota bacterium]